MSHWSEYNLSIHSQLSTWCKHILRRGTDLKYIWELIVTGASITQVLNLQRQAHQHFAQSVLPASCRLHERKIQVCAETQLCEMEAVVLTVSPAGSGQGAALAHIFLFFACDLLGCQRWSCCWWCCLGRGEGDVEELLPETVVKSLFSLGQPPLWCNKIQSCSRCWETLSLSCSFLHPRRLVLQKQQGRVQSPAGVARAESDLLFL